MALRKTNVWNVILSLAAYRKGRLYPCGTGFLIGRSLALTASHVVERPLDGRDYEPRHNRDILDYGMVAFQQVNGHHEALCWKIVSSHHFPVPTTDEKDNRSVDVSLIQLTPLLPLVSEYEDFRRWFLEINVAPPPLGSRVTAYGFAKSKIEPDQYPNCFVCTNAHVKVEGEVTKVFFPRRDQGFLPFPCFEISGDFVPGMSGGPIFNGNHQVCGVVSSGGISGISYGAVLWPVLAVEFDGKHLIDLARQGQIRAANHQCVTIHPSEHHQFPGITFDPSRSAQT